MAYKDIEVKTFVMQWNKIYNRTMKLLKETDAEESIYMLFSIEANSEDVISFKDITKIMNNDPQYIQEVKKSTNKRPYLTVVNGEGGIMLMLSLLPLVLSDA